MSFKCMSVNYRLKWNSLKSKQPIINQQLIKRVKSKASHTHIIMESQTIVQETEPQVPVVPVVGQHWKCLKQGFKAGRYIDFNRDSACYLNGSEFVQMYKNQNTKILIVQRFFAYPELDGTIVMKENEKLDLGLSDQIRIYEDVLIAKNQVGSKQLSKFIPVSERNDQNNFFITYDFAQKQWKGVWGTPKTNWKLDISNEGTLLVSNAWTQHTLNMAIQQANQLTQSE